VPALDDYRVVRVLGRGTFGKVMVVAHVATGERYAMKSFRKDTLQDLGCLAYVQTEEAILKQNTHPFLTKL
jgi:serine/threonine protein kinase